ncbi:sro-1 [Pristionchus pacificus]|uniref:Sro-1 n=1 Tax=Pristionchus pacificus TaxID=54126 RepID=A0A2A6B5U2_PRIPA|nr:sro-1 [Pristionchus pacificus]|eukprot:PDM61246.1 sro-1 [Pristionchus pacificus]
MGSEKRTKKRSEIRRGSDGGRKRMKIQNLFLSRQIFDDWNCQFYGAGDMALSLFEIGLATAIAFDRYIVTKNPKWGTWRSNLNYGKLLLIIFILCVLWSLVPWTGYGEYSPFTEKEKVFCSLNWRQADTLKSSVPSTSSPSQIMGEKGSTLHETTHRYIAFLTATFLIFFLIPVCIAGAFYYSIFEYVDKLNSIENREENGNNPVETCTWAPRNHVSKVGLGCLLTSTLPFMTYGIVCLNPLKADFGQLHVVITPVVLSRVAALLNPIFYIWLNPEIVGIEEKLLKKLQKKKSPPPNLRNYQTINLIADAARFVGPLPTMSFPILAPSAPRRQLPQIPPHLLSPRPSPTPQQIYAHFGDRLHPGAHHV